MPDVPRNKDSWNACLQVERIAICRPPGWPPAFSNKMLTGNEVTFGIPLNDPRQPISSGNCTRINEQCARRNGFLQTRFLVFNGYRFAMVGAFNRDDI